LVIIAPVWLISRPTGLLLAASTGPLNTKCLPEAFRDIFGLCSVAYHAANTLGRKRNTRQTKQKKRNKAAHRAERIAFLYVPLPPRRASRPSVRCSPLLQTVVFC